MGTQLLFPTRIYESRLSHAGWRGLNARLLRECRQLKEDDAAGRRWSAAQLSGRLYLLQFRPPDAPGLADLRRARRSS